MSGYQVNTASCNPRFSVVPNTEYPGSEIIRQNGLVDIPYTPTCDVNAWVAPAPGTVTEAIARLASFVSNNAEQPIPPCTGPAL
jgi:hypothetical protein